MFVIELRAGRWWHAGGQKDNLLYAQPYQSREGAEAALRRLKTSQVFRNFPAARVVKAPQDARFLATPH